jgi:hypothetical protein
MLIQTFGTRLRFACAAILCLLAAQPLAAQEVTGVPQIVDAGLASGGPQRLGACVPTLFDGLYSR